VFIDSIFATVMEFDAAIKEQYSPGFTTYDEHEPSAFGCGVRSGTVPEEKHTI